MRVDRKTYLASRVRMRVARQVEAGKGGGTRAKVGRRLILALSGSARMIGSFEVVPDDEGGLVARRSRPASRDETTREDHPISTLIRFHFAITSTASLKDFNIIFFVARGLVELARMTSLDLNEGETAEGNEDLFYFTRPKKWRNVKKRTEENGRRGGPGLMEGGEEWVGSA